MKKKICVIIILIVILTILLIAVNKLRIYNISNDNSTSNNEIELSFSESLDKNLIKIKSEYAFQCLINAVDKYYEAIKDGKENTITKMIDEKYKDIVKIEDLNLKKYYIDIDDVYMNEQDWNLTSYIVKVNIFNKITNKVTTEKIVVRIDMENWTFSIIPSKYIDNINTIKEGDLFGVSSEHIEDKTANRLDTFNGASYQILAKYYYDKIKNLSLYETKKAYEMLDSQYKEKNCKTLSEYKKLVKILFDEDCEATHYKRRLNSNQDITIECKDSKGNEYIIIIDFQNTGLTKFKYYKKS